MFFNVGSVFGGAVILLTALVLAGAALRLSGVKRYSPAFPYVLVPVFLVAVNLATRMFRGVYPYNLGELIGATLLIYVFLYLARGLGRR